MTLYGASCSPAIVGEAARLDPEADKRRLDELVLTADRLSGKDTKADQGTWRHTLTEHADKGLPLPAGASRADLDDLAAYLLTTARLTHLAVETFVVIPELAAAGTADRLAHVDARTPDGEDAGIVVADIKTGRLDYGIAKIEAQLASYSRGRKYDHRRFPVDTTDPRGFAAWKKTARTAEEAAAAYGPLPDVNQQWGLVIHLPTGKARCDLYWADLRSGWANAQFASAIRASRRMRPKLVPAALK
ncbi:hypothetical protein Afil01_62290 [Actinorhabdospora filicis]|uniref:Uncharacterized protein n=1 Tax=Actinorhabdospora filicis TaxID=1785913 RepID=A0A9W6ST96_9ACTN|nr:hypothetical protein [Actinorhabdospora filicis]GLZ81422.1 hypothetical protein Afil01_62290 [Actinorhabdospora filicis]